MKQPESEQELAAMVADARAPLRLIGGGTRGIVALAPGNGDSAGDGAGDSAGGGAGDILTTRGLSGVRLYDPGALTIVVGAGTPLAQVNAVLARENQQLSFEPADHRRLLGVATDGAQPTPAEPTIGGVVAANISGPRRFLAGACRDSLIGVRFVDGMGQVVKNGGRVMKNVTGYDLVKLMAGSHGTLGVITEVAFKVLPLARAQVTLRLRGLEDGRAVQAMARALATPYGVSGAAHLPDGAHGPETLLRLEGVDLSVRERADKLARALAEFGPAEHEAGHEDDPARGAEIWAGVRDVAPFWGQGGDVWRLSVRPSDAPGVVAGLGARAVIYDWGGGLIWALCAPGTDLRARLSVPGHATLVRAGDETLARIPRFHPEPAPLAAIAAGLRARFDPRGILNPGLMA